MLSHSLPSVGFRLCVEEGSEAVITAVEPLTSVGDVEALPALVMTVHGDNLFFISRAGYPPVASAGDAIGPVASTPVTTPCGTTDAVQGLVVGLRAASSTGGGWRGLAVEHTVEEKGYRLEIPAELYMCGTSTEPCGDE